jgi:hypothetical protein
MLNIYEPIAQVGTTEQIRRTGSVSAAKKSATTPSTAEQVLFLVENVYEISGETGATTEGAPHAMLSRFKGH